MNSLTKKEKIIAILFESFYTNEASIGVVKQDHKRDQRFRRMLEYSYFLCENSGKIYLSEDNNSCALILDTKKKKVTLKLIYWYGVLLFKVIGLKKAKQILNRLKTLNNARPKTDHIYIWYIGVKVNQQKKGQGSILMNQILTDNPDRIICLETTKPENFPFYKKNGFIQTGTVNTFGYSFALFRNKG